MTKRTVLVLFYMFCAAVTGYCVSKGSYGSAAFLFSMIVYMNTEREI